MQSNQKFSPTYPDNWDDMEAEPAAADAPGAVASAAAAAHPVQSVAPSIQAPSIQPPAAVAVAVAVAAAATPAPAAPMPKLGAAPVAIPRPEWLDRVPGLLARSAVFQVGRAGAGFERAPLACYGNGYSAIFEGPRLGMRDKRIWEVALRAAKDEGFAGAEFSLSASAIAKAIGARDSGLELRRIADALSRLAAARIEYAVPGGGGGSAALLGSARKASSGWRVSMDPGLIPLLGEDKQFRMDVPRRERLSSDLAKWMHDFMSTHESGFEVGFSLAKLAELCGWRGEAGHFPSSLQEALAELVQLCPELVAGFEIKRARRESRTWRARVDKGAESECFEVPAKRARAKADKPRRGGLNL